MNEALRNVALEAYGPKVRWLREGQSMSLRELARRISISASYLSDIETTRRLPSPDTSDLIADALGVDRNGLWQLAVLERLSDRDMLAIFHVPTRSDATAPPPSAHQYTDPDLNAAHAFGFREGVEFGRRDAPAPRDAAPLREHGPDDKWHRYGPITCEVCGQVGHIQLSLEPQASEPANADADK